MSLLDSRCGDRTISEDSLPASSDNRYVAPTRSPIENRGSYSAPTDYSPRYVATARERIETRSVAPTVTGNINQAASNSNDATNGYPLFGKTFNDLLTGGRLSGDRAIAVIPDTSGGSSGASPIIIIVLLGVAGIAYYFYQKNKG